MSQFQSLLARLKKIPRQWRPTRFRWWYIPVAIGVVIGLGLTVVLVSSVVHSNRYKDQPTQWGTSFSAQQAQWLGVDWRQNYTELLDDMGIKYLRLMSYWNANEPQQGVYNFDDLDWQFAEAHKRGATISLAIGLRQPRWPECHQPDWSKHLNEQQQFEALQNYLSLVVERYKDNPALESYQLENEALLHVFGECPERTREDLDAELQLIKKLDPNTPVYMSISDQYGLPIGKPHPDGYGFSLYRRHWLKELGFYWEYPFLPSWYGGRANIISWYTKGKPVFIHELQLEPWGPRPIPELSMTEQDGSMSAHQIDRVLQYARDTNIPRIYTWGSEWWYWRKTRMDDPQIWETVKQEFRKDQALQGQ